MKKIKKNFPIRPKCRLLSLAAAISVVFLGGCDEGEPPDVPPAIVPEYSCLAPGEASGLVDAYRASWGDDSDAAKSTRLRQLATFADYLYCIPVADVLKWDAWMARELGEALESTAVCDDIRSLWNPALLVLDHTQMTAESGFVSTVNSNQDQILACMSSVPEHSVWLDDFGTGRLVEFAELGQKRLLDLIFSPEKLGLGMCSLAAHAAGAHPMGCRRGFSRRLCSRDAQANLIPETTEQLLSLGIAEYRAEPLHLEGALGHTAEFIRPETLFGIQTDRFFSTRRQYMREFCGAADSNSGDPPNYAAGIAQRNSCTFRLILNETLMSSLLEQQPIYICDRATFEAGLDIVSNFPVRNPPASGGRNPHCWAGQDGADDDTDDEEWRVMSRQPRGSTVQHVGNPLRSGEDPTRDARYTGDDMRRAYDEANEDLRANGQPPLDPLTEAEFESLADYVNERMRNAVVLDADRYGNSVVLGMTLQVGRSLTPDEESEARNSWGVTFADPEDILVREHPDPAVERRTVLHEGMHIALRNMGLNDGDMQHAIMKRLGVWRPTPDSEGGSNCQTAAEMRASQLHQCMEAQTVPQDPDEIDVLAPYIYVLNPPRVFAGCDAFYDPQAGFTDPSPIEDDSPPVGRGPNYNNPRIGAIDPCPPGAECGGVAARMPGGYDRDALNELIREVRSAAEDSESDDLQPQVVGTDAEFSETPRE